MPHICLYLYMCMYVINTRKKPHHHTYSSLPTTTTDTMPKNHVGQRHRLHQPYRDRHLVMILLQSLLKIYNITISHVFYLIIGLLHSELCFFSLCKYLEVVQVDERSKHNKFVRLCISHQTTGFSFTQFLLDSPPLAHHGTACLFGRKSKDKGYVKGKKHEIALDVKQHMCRLCSQFHFHYCYPCRL